MPNAEIIAIGTELLLGETLDTNTRFIAQVLRSLGIDLFQTQTVGDNAGRIAVAIQEAVERAKIVITTGGLGPTVDDPTRLAIANAIGVKLEYHPELWEQISDRISRYGRIPTENQKRQAYVPENALIIENPVGTAPAFIVEFAKPNLKFEPGYGKNQRSLPFEGDSEKVKGGVIVSLPGVPREMETLLTGSVVPYLKKHFDLHYLLKIRTLHVSGLGEGMIDNLIGDLETLANPTVGLAAHSGIVDIRITAKGSNGNEASHMIASVEKELISRLGNNIFGADEETLESVILKAIIQKGWTLACLEVNLEGMLLTRFTRTGQPVYLGGIGSQVGSEALAAETESIRRKLNASSALGVAYCQENDRQDIYIIQITPKNMAMDLIRHTVQDYR
jgi:nicotinamide-nucleotide amidase